MIWLTWRQHRWEGLVGGLFFGLLAAASIAAATQAGNAIRELGWPGCLTAGGSPICGQAQQEFARRLVWTARYLVPALLVLPALLGIFIGAPLLAREFEAGTHRLVWTQGITRLRWLGSKLALVIAAAAAGSALLAILGAWWWPLASPTATKFHGFDAQGLALVGYALFALAAGLAAGALIGRVIPATLLTLAAFVAARIFVASALRPRYLPPVIEDGGVGRNPFGADRWVLGIPGYVDAQGHALDQATLSGISRTCIEASGGNKSVIPDCFGSKGIFYRVVFQPEDRFWLFQSIEAAIFIALAIALIALTVWWVKRRTA